jgi:ribosomal protein S18 acetylase RimI-like enzyme
VSDPVGQDEAAVVIRWAVFEDLARLEKLLDIWELRESNLRAFESYRAGRLLWLIADLGGEPIGTVWGELFPEHDPSGMTVHIVSFRVHDAYQGRGIGSRLLRSVEEEAYLRGRRIATLLVAQENTGAIRLYERHGYKIVGSRTSRFDFRDPAGKRHRRIEEQFVMRKSLSQGADTL